MLNWMDSLKGRSMMRLASFTDEEMLNLIDLAAQLKARRAAGVRGDLLHRKNIALIFEKSSTRTRNSCVVAARDEGGGAEYLTRPDIHFGKKESVKDTARVLGRIYDGILFRGFKQSDCEALAKYSGVPVWNGLTDDYHPTQIFADLLTVRETFGSLEGVTVAYVGDGRNNVANSLMMGCAKCKVNYVCCCPKELEPDPAVLAEAEVVAKRNGVDIRVTADAQKGVKGTGIEIDFERIVGSTARDLDVLFEDADQGLGLLPDRAYDMAVLSETLQTVKKPREILVKILDKANEAIVTIPNFAAVGIRFHLLFTGRMPVGSELPFEWYDTPNTHFFTFDDFKVLCAREGIEIKEVRAEAAGLFGRLLLALGLKNLGADRLVCRLARKA